MAIYEKTKSGKWRARVFYYQGDKRKCKSFTAPTKAETVEMATKFEAISNKPISNKKTVREAILEYINISEVLSPTTLQGYNKTLQYAFHHIMDTDVSELTDKDMQIAINIESKRIGERTGKQISPKTVKNEWGLVSSAIKATCGRTFEIKLPKQQHRNVELPNPSDVINAIKGSSVELPCLLALEMGMRMEEIRGLMCSSVKNGLAFIDSVVVDVDNIEVRKSLAKTDKSIRKVKIQPDVMRLIESKANYQEWIKNGVDSPLIGLTRNQIYHSYSRLIKKAGLSISFHDLRHEYASICHDIGIPDQVIMDNCGWKTDHVMKEVYRQSFSDSRKAADDKVRDFFNSLKN